MEHKVEITSIENLGEVLLVTGLVDGKVVKTTTKSPLMWGDFSEEALNRGIYNLLICRAEEPVVKDEPLSKLLELGEKELAATAAEHVPDAARMASVAKVESDIKAWRSKEVNRL
jgi:hypothetical protein